MNSEVKWILWREESIWGGNLCDLNPQRNCRHLVNKGQGTLKWWKLVLKPLTISLFLLQDSWSLFSITQTWDLSKLWHRRIFRPKILHPYFHWVLPVLVIKTPKNEWKWSNAHTIKSRLNLVHGNLSKVSLHMFLKQLQQGQTSAI